jgi:hypothetical protein
MHLLFVSKTRVALVFVLEEGMHETKEKDGRSTTRRSISLQDQGCANCNGATLSSAAVANALRKNAAVLLVT